MNNIKRGFILAVLVLLLFFPAIPHRIHGDVSTVFNYARLFSSALENNTDLRISRDESEVAKIEEKKALYEGLPKVSMDFSFSHIANPQDAIGVDAGSMGSLPAMVPGGESTPIPGEDITVVEEQDPFFYSVSLQLEQPIFTWGKLRGKRMIRGIQKEASLLLVRKNIADIQTSLAILLQSLYYLNTISGLLETQNSTADRLLEITEENYANGFILYSTVLDIRLLVRETEHSLLQVRREEETVLNRLSRLTGIDDLTRKNIEGKNLLRGDKDFINKDDASLIETAFTNNMDLQLLEFQKNASAEELSVIRGKNYFKPDLGLLVDASVSGSRMPFIGDNWEDRNNWNITTTIALKTTLFDSGVISSDIKAAEVKGRISAQNIEKAEEDLKLSILETVSELRTSINQQALLELTVEASREKVKWKKEQFESGAGSESEYLGEQLEWYGQQIELYREMIRYSSTLFQLYNAVMGGVNL